MMLRKVNCPLVSLMLRTKSAPPLRIFFTRENDKHLTQEATFFGVVCFFFRVGTIFLVHFFFQ